MNSILSDLRFACRMLAKSPGFTAAAITVLALGIGLNTAVFSLTYSVAFSPRPFAQPDRVFQLYTQDQKEPTRFRSFSYPLFREIAARRDLFAEVLAHKLTTVGIGEQEATRRSLSALVSANYFSALGVRLAQGRAFTADEERPGASATVAIASHDYWRKTGFAPHLVGSTVRVNEQLFTIVGITPAGFSGTTMLFGPELYFPLGVFDRLHGDGEEAASRTLERADSFNLLLVARLAEGVSAKAATAALAAIGSALQREFPVEFKDQGLTLGSLPRLTASASPGGEKTAGRVGVLLLGMSMAVLLVVCLNLAGLMIARGHARRKEFAIRLALGSGRWRLVRQLCVEGGVLALGGGALGFLIAAAANQWLSAALSQRLPVALFFSSPLSTEIIVASAMFCLLSTLFFTLGPALKLSRADVFADLKLQAGATTSQPRRRWLPRQPLVIAQIAISLALLVGASLLLRNAFGTFAKTETGFHAEHAVLAEVDSSLGGFTEAQSRNLFLAVQARLAALPGVQAASVSATVPFGTNGIYRNIRRAGARPSGDAKPSTAAEGLAFFARWNAVGADFFSVWRLPLLQGRAFTAVEADAPGAPEVAILDEVLARKLWPGGDALGQRIQWADNPGTDGPDAGRQSRTLEIVGIARATRETFGQKEAGHSVYVPFAQGFRPNVHFQVRPAADNPDAATALVASVRRAVRETAPNLPLLTVRTYRQHREANLEAWAVKIFSALFAFFGFASMLVAVVGIYGAQAYAVSLRTREIGVRMALGAQSGQVRSMVLREGGMVAGAGVVVGLVLALAVSSVMATLFVDVPAFDGAVFLLAAVAFSAALLAACWFPACRAMRVSPTVALRSE